MIDKNGLTFKDVQNVVRREFNQPADQETMELNCSTNSFQNLVAEVFFIFLKPHFFLEKNQQMTFSEGKFLLDEMVTDELFI